MRLVCPSCHAQYEIDSSLLPDEGREVQCSACGNIWFQEGRTQHASGNNSDPPADARPPSTSEAEPQDAESDAPAPPKPRPVDEKVLGILREEAEFEAQQRARDAGTLETQPELGLLGASPWPKTSEGEDSTPPREPEQAKTGTGPSAFPDIEDISSTLEPIGHSRARKNAEFDLPATSEDRQRSFLRGFAIPVILAAVLVGAYIAAPAIINALPAAEPALTAYVGTIDGLRHSISGLVSN